jgi:hypothetical protein
MSLARFLTYIQYSRACPPGIRLNRWRGMLRFYRKRLLEGFWQEAGYDDYPAGLVEYFDFD